MKPFAGKMSKDEMRSVAEFVMALKPGAASP
jgi:cytochrome c553